MINCTITVVTRKKVFNFIENNFRDIKNQRIEFSLNNTATQANERLNSLFIASTSL